MRTRPHNRSLLPLAALLTIAGVTTAQSDKALTKQLRSKDATARLEALQKLVDSNGKALPKALAKTHKDRDWEVRERTFAALATVATKTRTKVLIDACLTAPLERHRRIAAEALAQSDPDAAAAKLYKRATSKVGTLACAALAIVLPACQDGKTTTDKLAKLRNDKVPALRAAAVRAWVAGAKDRAKAVATVFAESRLGNQAAVLTQLAFAPQNDDRPILIALCSGPRRVDVVERRLLDAVLAWATLADDAKAGAGFLDSIDPGTGAAKVRVARLLPRLVQAKRCEARDACERLVRLLNDDDEAVRAAATKALRAEAVAATSKIESLDAAITKLGYEQSARVRYQLLDTIVALGGVQHEKSVAAVRTALEKDPAVIVRERAAVHLGHQGAKGVVPALRDALGDDDWGVAVCAAVSLGKTGQEEATEPLTKLVAHTDWKYRGAAAVGFMHCNRAESIAPLIQLLEDSHATVQAAAFEALQVVSDHRDFPADAKRWQAWWDEMKDRHRFRDRRALNENRKKYGYAVPDQEIYQGLDVVVFTSRGDHIEELLSTLEIEHRKTRAKVVDQAKLHPEAIFVCNCTGEIEQPDIEPLRWFVLTGGYFFGSCWALSQSIEKIYPGVLKKFETPKGEVLDDVIATPCAPKSPYLNGVFAPYVTPIYHLEGAHLIELVDPERAEVLIDSSGAADRHGSGNLAAWFDAGHGVILDSVNHFDLQGLEVAPGLKSEADRQAYAVDHMGLSYAKWRQLQSESFWKNAHTAAQQVADRSAFRFITNFVRHKRTEGL